MTDQLLFDKLRFVDRLTRAGISDDQARAEAMEDALRESVATKSDLVVVRNEVAAVKSDLQRDIITLKHDLTVRMGLMTAATIAILTSIKFFTPGQ